MNDAVAERPARYFSGWLMLPIVVAFAAWVAWLIVAPAAGPGGHVSALGVVLIPLVLLLFKGFVILEPNMAAVMTFFGNYAGTISADGLFWVNPLYSKQKISLRAHNLNTPTLKVNDRAGNPVEVAAVIVWRVRDTARAVFDVEDYVDYVTIQSESAVRQVVSQRWYDGDEKGQHSLRGDLDSVARLLAESIQHHCDLAGLEVVEARISHLAYAPEIAGAMLRRQQAIAVVAARRKIVEGAVGMVRQAVAYLERSGSVSLEPADRARMVTNLMTVLVGDRDAQPVVSVDAD